jgi:hypothetical protein
MAILNLSGDGWRNLLFGADGRLAGGGFETKSIKLFVHSIYNITTLINNHTNDLSCIE